MDASGLMIHRSFVCTAAEFHFRPKLPVVERRPSKALDFRAIGRFCTHRNTGLLVTLPWTFLLHPARHATIAE